MTEPPLAPAPVPAGQPAELGSALRRLRRSAGLSQQQMARALGLSSHSSIAYYETGRRVPPADIIDAYERALIQPPGTLHLARLRTLAARAELDEREEQPAGHRQQPATALAPVPVSEPEAPGAARTGRTRRQRSALLAATALSATVLATTAASTAAGAALDPTWTQSTQNVTSRIEPAATPEPMDGDDPRARDCYADAVIVQTTPLLLPNGTYFGVLRLRHSKHCGASWGSAYYSNPQLYMIRIIVHRLTDNAVIRDDWSNDTPPGSYSDMLSTGTGCVWVEAEVITPTGTGAPAKTGCLT